MASTREKRRTKNLQKKKKSRQRAKDARSARTKQTAASPSKASLWPAGECFVTENWYEWGTTIHAAFSRVHQDGGTVGALFQVNLETGKILHAETFSGLDQSQFVGSVASRTEGETLISTEPAHVVHIGMHAAKFGVEQGHRTPSAWQAIVKLFGDIDPATSPYDIQLGLEGEQEVTEEVTARPSVGERIMGWLGR
jgi:hypothetical protein